jgi:uncharacterized protein
VRGARPLPVLLLIALIGGCASSPPTQFYTLAPAPPQERTLHASVGPIQVAPVHMPAVLERQEIVSETGPSQIVLSNRHRWGAPLAEMTRRTLTQDLLQRLPTDQVVLPEQPAPPDTRQLVVDVLRFQPDATGRVVLEGSWSLVPPGSESPSLTRNISLSEQANATSYADEVQAMSRVLGKLADDIVSALAK